MVLWHFGPTVCSPHCVSSTDCLCYWKPSQFCLQYPPSMQGATICAQFGKPECAGLIPSAAFGADGPSGLVHGHPLCFHAMIKAPGLSCIRWEHQGLMLKLIPWALKERVGFSGHINIRYLCGPVLLSM